VLGGLPVAELVLARREAGWSPLPAARYLPGVAYDVKRDVLVLFGGGDPAGMDLFGDTWELDGTTWRRISQP